MILTQGALATIRDQVATGHKLAPRLAAALLDDRDEWVKRAFEIAKRLDDAAHK